MSDERFDADLRAVLEELAPADVPPELRLAVLDVPRRRPHSRVPWPRTRRGSFVLTLAALAVVLVAALAVVLLHPFPSGPTAGAPPTGSALPSPHSALVSGWVEQTDGAYGYRMLRPANWTTTSGDGLQRSYLAPGFQAAGTQGVLIAVTNYEALGTSAGANTIVAQWGLFQQHPEIADWTAALERMMQQDAWTYRLVRTLPNARIYAIPAMPGQQQPTIVVFAYVIAGGQPFGLELQGFGTYHDLATLEQDGVLDDFATMVGSIAPVPADPANVVPPMPTPPAGLAGGPTASPTEALPAATPAPSSMADYVVRPAVSTPAKSVTDQAVGVLSARLRALGVGNFTIAAGDTITVRVPASADQGAVRAALTTTGEVSFVPLPAATYGTSTGGRRTRPVPNPGETLDPTLAPLLGSAEIASAHATTDASGSPAVDLRFTPQGTRLFADWSTAHVGEFFAVVLDGRVLMAPYVESPITDGTGMIALGQGGLPAPVSAIVAILESGPLPAAWRQGR